MTRLLRAVQDALTEGGVEQGRAPGLARQVVEAVLGRLGGARAYLPSPVRRRNNERDAQVVAAFTGFNRDAVCTRFGISQSTFYRILHRAGAGVYRP